MQHQTPPHPKPRPEVAFQEEKSKFSNPVGLLNIAVVVLIALLIIVGIILVSFHII